MESMLSASAFWIAAGSNKSSAALLRKTAFEESNEFAIAYEAIGWRRSFLHDEYDQQGLIAELLLMLLVLHAAVCYECSSASGLAHTHLFVLMCALDVPAMLPRR